MLNQIPFQNANLLIVLLSLLFASYAKGDYVKSKAPALQLANIYHSDISLHDYWVSEKLDGVRAYWNGKHFLSKQGHIYQAPKWFIKDFPDFSLDGELWLGRGQFDRLSGAVRKQVAIDKEWQSVTYQVFDLPEHTENFDKRLAYLKEYFSTESLPAWVRLVPQYKVKNEQALMLTLQQVEDLKGEGLMLHKGSAFYRSGRGDDLLKLKTYQDAEARVLSHLPGKGKYQNMLGSLLVEAVNHKQKTKRFKIGTGFSDAERTKPPEVGSIITYKYFGLTSKGIPRFASFMRIRKEN